MASVEDSSHDDSTAPSSPPDLSYRSSNSSMSSLQTDSFCEKSSTDLSTAGEEETNDTPSQDEEVGDCNVKAEDRPTLRRPSPRIRKDLQPDKTDTTHLPAAFDHGSRSNSDGDLQYHKQDSRSHVIDFARPGYPTRISRSPLPSPGYSHSPHSPNFSRSPSPATTRYLPQRFASTPSLPTLAPHSQWERRPSLGVSGTNSRRTSWQPNRKTVQELEAEYDDADEDVPDEAILANVPITPIPGMPSMLPRRSTPSPSRRIPPPHQLGAHGNLHSANIPKHARRAVGPPVMHNGQHPPSRSPRAVRPPMLRHSETAPVGTREGLAFKQRSTSWARDLNDEARKLSAALEQHVKSQPEGKRDSATSVSSKRSSNSNSPPALIKSHSTSSILEIPKTPRGNVVIDPLPLSKEKEAVLTRTRPSWLPPKSQKEERKHMKQWEQMMAQARTAEKRRASKQKEELETQGEMQGSLDRVWEQHVLKNWDTSILESSTRELWWRGIPADKHGVVWSKAVKKERGSTASTYEQALQQVIEKEMAIAKLTVEERANNQDAKLFDSIQKLAAPVSTVQVDRDKDAQNALLSLLKAHAIHHGNDIDISGLQLVANTALRHLTAPEAFVILTDLASRPISHAFLINDGKTIDRTYNSVLETLKYKFPSLHAHITNPKMDLQPQEYLDTFFRTLFAQQLPAEHLNRLWDIYVFEGDRTLIRAAVAVLGKLESRLYGSREEILELLQCKNGKKLDLGSPDQFIQWVRDAGKVEADRQAPEVIC